MADVRIARLGKILGVSAEVAGKLVAAGYGTPRLVKVASDEDILGISGIGQATLDAIRVRAAHRGD